MLALPQAIAAGVCLMAAGFLWPLRRESTAAAWLLTVLVGAALWSFAGAMEFLAIPIKAKVFWTQVSYMGITLGPIGLFHFSYARTRGVSPPPHGSVEHYGPGFNVLLSAAPKSTHRPHCPVNTP
ncbi:MAG: histidine kinase N-terminal 7TM domain-containing protein, partial [Rariglobus sp.]